MNSPVDSYESIPIGALVNLPDEVATAYITKIHKLPPLLFNTATSMETSGFILGMLKNQGLSTSFGPSTALIILSLLLGEKTLAQLPSLLSTELKISNDKAQSLAREIEREVIAPVSEEFSRYLAAQKRTQGSLSSKLTETPSHLANSRGYKQRDTRMEQRQNSSKLPVILEKTAQAPTTSIKPQLLGKSRVPPNPANILDLKKKWEQPKPPPIPH